MLLIDTTFGEVCLICITSLVGICGVSAGLEGYFFHNMKLYQRIMSAVGGLLLIYPGVVTDTAGLALVLAVVAMQFVEKRKLAAA